MARNPSTRRLYIENADAMSTASWTSPSEAPAAVAASTSASPSRGGCGARCRRSAAARASSGRIRLTAPRFSSSRSGAARSSPSVRGAPRRTRRASPCRRSSRSRRKPRSRASRAPAAERVAPGKSWTSSSSASPRRWTPSPGVSCIDAVIRGASGRPPTIGPAGNAGFARRRGSSTASCAGTWRPLMRAIGRDPTRDDEPIGHDPRWHLPAGPAQHSRSAARTWPR